jgi:hypothetical protein
MKAKIMWKSKINKNIKGEGQYIGYSSEKEVEKLNRENSNLLHWYIIGK